MDIESVRALKSEIAEQVIEPRMREGRRFGLSARSVERGRVLRPHIALGVGLRDRTKGYNLEVRIQRRLLDAERDIRANIERRSRGEVDIRYVGEIKKAQQTKPPWQQRRHRPLLSGISLAHFDVTAGTLGCFAIERKRQKVVILSNNHVLANEDRAEVGDAIIQPGRYDAGRRDRDQVATLLKVAPLKPSGNNFVDAAIASLQDDIQFDATKLTDLGTLLGRRQDPIEPGDEVFKIGRTTGITRGTVTAVELDDVVVAYDRGEFRFDGQIEIEGSGAQTFSDGGDSGSLVVDARCFGCALLFAGSDQGGTNGMGLTYANALGPVLDALGIDLTTEG